MTEVIRPTLGAYMSIECFRYLRFGAEDTAGRALIVSAGKQRGHSLKDVLKGVNSEDVSQLKATLAKLLGVDGTRLCMVDDVTKTATGYEVRVSESACCYGVKSDENVCAYTLGVFSGVMEVVSGKRIAGQETECAATGHEQCVYKLDIL